MIDRTDELDLLLSQAADQKITPSEGMMDRILRDAASLQPSPAPAAKGGHETEKQGPGFWGVLSDWFGGTGALAGMSAAALAGLYIGAVQPSMVSGLTSLVSGETTIETLDLLPATGTLWAEE